LTGRIVLLELNEVPYQVLDAYCERRPQSILAQVLARSDQYRTLAEDQLALDPWVSWATLHRGVTDKSHGILHLGQVLTDTDGRFPPIWRILKEKGHDVGVFGSLHSSHLPADVESYSFYLPDYFDSAAFAHPRELLPFQELNLAMTRQSARNVTRRIPARSLVKFLASAPDMGLRAATLGACATHLVREALDRSQRIRRRAYQPLITMDLFLAQLRKHRPQFASFYTNHVAAAMHRYWGATFPEDYDADKMDADWIGRYAEEIWFAMDKFDVMLRHLVAFIDDDRDYRLMVASSMGQAAIPAIKTHQFLTVTDPGAFLAALGVPPGEWQLRPAMVPCCCVQVSEGHREALTRQLDTVALGDGSTRMQQATRPTGSMSYNERERGFFQFYVQYDNYAGPDQVLIGGVSRTLSAAGLGFMTHEDGVNCTAQHIPTGSLWVYRLGSSHRGAAGAARREISTLDVAPSLLRFFGHSPPSYMEGKASVNLQ
jgi:hypothetical protein